MGQESSLIARVLLRASSLGGRLFRNQVGKYRLADGRWLSSGLCVGSSDVIGWQVVEITPAMVGQRFARFVALEVKTARTRTTAAQSRFLRVVAADGGVAGIVREDADVLRLLNGQVQP